MSRRKITSCVTVFTLLLGIAALLGGCKGDSLPVSPESLRADLDTVISGVRQAPPPEDPARGGWDTEVFSARAQDTLKAFAHLLDSPPAENTPGELLSREFHCSAFRPARQEEIFRQGHFIVRRASGEEPRDAVDAARSPA